MTNIRFSARQTHKLIFLSVFAIAMALLEAAVVVYMRELYYADNIRSLFPVRIITDFDTMIELLREAATVIMILSVALAAEWANLSRIFACFIFLFGAWDIFYYIWLKIFIDWPAGFFDWDVLFLIPLPWLGPWICPVLISTLFVCNGGFILAQEKRAAYTGLGIALFALGSLVAIVSFLEPIITLTAPGLWTGKEIAQPQSFAWHIFIPGFLLMSSGLFLPSTLFPKKSNS